MKPTQLEQKTTPCKQYNPTAPTKATDTINTDSRYDYLMLLTNDWIASQNHTSDFIRSVN